MKSIERRVQALEKRAQALEEKREDEAWQAVLPQLSDAELEHGEAIAVLLEADETGQSLSESDWDFVKKLKAMGAPVEWEDS